MSALVWYALSLLGRSQSYIAPSLLFATMLVVLTTNDVGALTDAYAACATAQFLCMTWLTISLLNAEDPIQRAMTSVNAGSGHRVLFAHAVAATLISAALTVVGLGYPILAGRPVVTLAALAVGAIAQLACGWAGITIGVLCCRQVIPRAGYAVLLAVVLVGLLMTVPGLPPVGPLLTLLSRDENAQSMLLPVSGLAAIAASMLVGCYLAVAALSRRRD